MGLRGILGITGTPGTGKKSVAPIVARALGVPCVGLNDAAGPLGVMTRNRRWAEVDTARLRAVLPRHLARPSVVYGHLLPYSLGRRDVEHVVVLRCEPSVLKQRLGSRGYSEAKMLANVEAELIGATYADALRAFGRKTVEEDTTYLTPDEAAAEVLSIAMDRRPSAAPIEWMRNYDTPQKLRSLLPSF